MALHEAICWIANAIFSTVVSSLGFYCLAVIVDYAKTYYKEKRQKEHERLSRELQEVKAYHEWKEGRIGIGREEGGVGIGGFVHHHRYNQYQHQFYNHSTNASRGASIFSAYKMSSAFMSCTAKPRRRRSHRPSQSQYLQQQQQPLSVMNESVDDGEGGKNCIQPFANHYFPFMAATRAFMWSSLLSEFSRVKSIASEELCSRCKINKKNTCTNDFENGEPNNSKIAVLGGIVSSSHELDHNSGGSQVVSKIFNAGSDVNDRDIEVISPHLRISQQAPGYKHTEVAEAKKHVALPNVKLKLHSLRSNSINTKNSQNDQESTFHQEMVRRATREYPFIVPFIDQDFIGNDLKEGKWQGGTNGVKEAEIRDERVTEIQSENVGRILESQRHNDGTLYEHKRDILFEDWPTPPNRDAFVKDEASKTKSESCSDGHLQYNPKELDPLPSVKSPVRLQSGRKLSRSNHFHKSPTKETNLLPEFASKKGKDPSQIVNIPQCSLIKRGNTRSASDIKTENQSPMKRVSNLGSKERFKRHVVKPIPGKMNSIQLRNGANESNEKETDIKYLNDEEKYNRTTVYPNAKSPAEYNANLRLKPQTSLLENSQCLNADQISSPNRNYCPKPKDHTSQSVIDESGYDSIIEQMKIVSEKNHISSLSDVDQKSNEAESNESRIKCQDLLCPLLDKLDAGCNDLLPIDDLIKVQEEMLSVAETHKSKLTPAKKDDRVKNNKKITRSLRKSSTKASRLRQVSNLREILHSASIDKREVSTQISAPSKSVEKKNMTRKVPIGSRRARSQKRDYSSAEKGRQITITNSQLIGRSIIKATTPVPQIQKKRVKKPCTSDGTSAISQKHKDSQSQNNQKLSTMPTNKRSCPNQKLLMIKPPPVSSINSNDKNGSIKIKQITNKDENGETCNDNKCLLRKSVLDDVVSQLNIGSSFLKKTPSSDSECPPMTKPNERIGVSNLAIDVVCNYAINISSVFQNNVSHCSTSTSSAENSECVFGELQDLASLVSGVRE